MMTASATCSPAFPARSHEHACSAGLAFTQERQGCGSTAVPGLSQAAPACEVLSSGLPTPGWGNPERHKSDAPSRGMADLSTPPQLERRRSHARQATGAAGRVKSEDTVNAGECTALAWADGSLERSEQCWMMSKILSDSNC